MNTHSVSTITAVKRFTAVIVETECVFIKFLKSQVNILYKKIHF
jgi:hypothetical protein